MDAPDPGSVRPFLIGAAGAVVGALGLMQNTTLRAKVANLVCGTLVAGFVAPALVEWFHLPGPGVFGGICFLLGAVGISFMQAITDFVKSTRFGEMLSSWGTRK